MTKRKKRVGKLFPFIFFFAVFSFMLFFRHETVFTKGDARSIESVTYTDEWLTTANIPTELKDKTAELDGPLRSRIIHRIIQEEPLNIVYVPSMEFLQHMNEEPTTVFAGDTLPSWAEEASSLFSEKYDADLLQWSFIDPALVAPVYPEGKDAEDFLYGDNTFRTGDDAGIRDEQEQTNPNDQYWDDSEEEEDTENNYTDQSGNQRLPLEDQAQEDPIYLEAARNIRALEPDIVLFDMTLLVEHFEDEYPTYRDVAMATREFLQTLYRSRDRFYTILIMENAVYEHLGYETRSENLDEYINNLTAQLDYTTVNYIGDFYDQEISYDTNDLFYSVSARKIADMF